MLYKFDKDNFKYTPVNEVKYFYSIVFGTIGVILFTFIITSFMYNSNKNKEYMESEVVINLVTNESFSKEKFISEVKLSRFRYPDIIIAQAYIETSHFTSQVWEQNRNLFGMKLPLTRFTLAVDVNLNHAVYKNWKASLKDRLIYEALYLHKIKDKDEYYEFLDVNYARAGGKRYSELIKEIIKTHKLDKI
jgi:flagellum-specific peptidoglycan hydrolase FlgJ